MKSPVIRSSNSTLANPFSTSPETCANRLYHREERVVGPLSVTTVERLLLADSVEKLQIAFSGNSRECALQSTIDWTNRQSANQKARSRAQWKFVWSPTSQKERRLYGLRIFRAALIKRVFQQNRPIPAVQRPAKAPVQTPSPGPRASGPVGRAATADLSCTPPHARPPRSQSAEKRPTARRANEIGS